MNATEMQRNCCGLKETKETSLLNAMCDPSLNPGLEKQNCYTGHYRDSWQNVNKDCRLWYYIIVKCLGFEWCVVVM